VVLVSEIIGKKSIACPERFGEAENRGAGAIC